MAVAVVNPSYPVRLYYEIHEPTTGVCHGNVFCIMGFAIDGWTWWQQVEVLTANGYRVVTYDNRGSGRSDFSKGPYSIQLLADDAWHLLTDVLHWNIRETHIVSVSMGGMIALVLLSNLADRALVLNDSSRPCRALSVTLMVTQARGWRSFGGLPPLSNVSNILGFFSAYRPEHRSQVVLNSAYTREYLAAPSRRNPSITNQQEMLARFRGKYLEKKSQGFVPEVPLAPLVSQVIAVATHYLTDEQLDRIKLAGTEILVIGAGRDALVRPSSHKYLARLCSKPENFVFFENAAHFVKDEELESVMQNVLRVFKEALQRDNRRSDLTAKL
eukprot:c10485_g1_i2.p1 GENE.c10485_g1_i2~~c10485_g1_i2.p1  ORF type:complete len:347 (-),score=71.75 c10485_g1_i2:46-1032(-)